MDPNCIGLKKIDMDPNYMGLKIVDMDANCMRLKSRHASKLHGIKKKQTCMQIAWD